MIKIQVIGFMFVDDGGPDAADYRNNYIAVTRRVRAGRLHRTGVRLRHLLRSVRRQLGSGARRPRRRIAPRRQFAPYASPMNG